MARQATGGVMVHHEFAHELFVSVVFSTLNNDGQPEFTHRVLDDGAPIKVTAHGDDAKQARRDHFAAVDMYLDIQAVQARH